jgi:hypothetical protein
MNYMLSPMYNQTNKDLVVSDVTACRGLGDDVFEKEGTGFLVVHGPRTSQTAAIRKHNGRTDVNGKDDLKVVKCL